MEAAFIELLITGRVPGTQADINFEAFLQGVVFGLIVLVIIKTLLSVRKATKETTRTSTITERAMELTRPQVYRPRGQVLES